MTHTPASREFEPSLHAVAIWPVGLLGHCGL